MTTNTNAAWEQRQDILSLTIREASRDWASRRIRINGGRTYLVVDLDAYGHHLGIVENDREARWAIGRWGPVGCHCSYIVLDPRLMYPELKRAARRAIRTYDHGSER